MIALRSVWFARIAAVAAIAATAACVGSTGGSTVAFDVAAAGVALPGGGNAIDTGLGWHVVLTKANLHIGAVYMNLSVPNSGAQGTSCILPGIYTGQVLSGLDVDVLSPTPQPFPTQGTGTDDDAKTAEVWLTGGDINATSDPTIIADIAGTATNATSTLPFTAKVTIGANRLSRSSDPAQPSAHPICKERIVTPIRIDLRPVNGATLLVSIDPSEWFANVDFTGLVQVSTTPPAYIFPDDNVSSASQSLFAGLTSGTGTFSFTFQ